MTSRERWILYPLLFFSLCMGAKSQFPAFRGPVLRADRIECRELSSDFVAGDRINCRELTASAGNGARQVQIGNAAGGGELVQLFGPFDRQAAVLGVNEQGGAVRIENFTGAMVQLQSADGRGVVSVVDKRGEIVGQQPLPLGLLDLRGIQFAPQPAATPEPPRSDPAESQQSDQSPS
jgi:hypothetical protein